MNARIWREVAKAACDKAGIREKFDAIDEMANEVMEVEMHLRSTRRECLRRANDLIFSLNNNGKNNLKMPIR